MKWHLKYLFCFEATPAEAESLCSEASILNRTYPTVSCHSRSSVVNRTLTFCTHVAFLILFLHFFFVIANLAFLIFAYHAISCGCSCCKSQTNFFVTAQFSFFEFFFNFGRRHCNCSFVGCLHFQQTMSLVSSFLDVLYGFVRHISWSRSNVVSPTHLLLEVGTFKWGGEPV